MAQRIVKRGTVVLVRYPFTDLTGAKARPAVVLTPDTLLRQLDDVFLSHPQYQQPYFQLISFWKQRIPLF